MGSGSPCLFCGADIPSGETIRMVTRYSCRNCWSQDIDKLLADCRAALERVTAVDFHTSDCPYREYMRRGLPLEMCLGGCICYLRSVREMLARLPERKEAQP